MKASLLVATLAILLCAAFLLPAHGAYFYLLDTEPSCFIEDIPEDTAILIKYAALDYDQIGLGLGGNQQVVKLTVTDPNSRDVVAVNTVKKGQVAFTSKMSGDHKICVDIMHSPRHGRQYKFGLKVQSSSESADTTSHAKGEHFNAIVVELNKLNDRIVNHRKEHKYLKKLEEKTRDETESVYDTIFIACAVQSFILVAATIFQIWFLRRFFKTKLFGGQ